LAFALMAAGMGWADDKQPASAPESRAPDTVLATFASGLFITREGIVVEPPLTLRLARDTLLDQNRDLFMAGRSTAEVLCEVLPCLIRARHGRM
jgi:hypothetical protein